MLRKCWSVRCGADMVSARLRIVLDQPSPAARLGCCVRGSCGVRPLRQSYITPHCSQCPPVSRKLLLCPRTASRPAGLRSRRYAKLPSLERSPVVGAPRSLRALRAAASRPSGVLALWHMSGASRMVLVGGFAVHLVLAPAHPWVLLASQLRPRGLPVRPPRGLPQNRASLHLCFATKLVAGYAINTGARGLKACKPA